MQYVRRATKRMEKLPNQLLEAVRPRRAASRYRGRHRVRAHQMEVRWAHLQAYNISEAQVSSTL